MAKACEIDTPISTMNIRRVYVAIELSKSAWVIAIQSPAVDKVSLFRIPGGDIEKLFVLLEQVRHRISGAFEVCACYEAGYDGFWIHRALTARGVACTVLDSASIQVSRRRRRVKTDRTDAEGLVRMLMAIYRGEHQVAKIVHVPSSEEEDDKRLLRSRGNLLRDRIRHTNRIRGLLNLQGVRHIDPNRPNWEATLVNLLTGDGRSFPRQLMCEIRREAKLLSVVMDMLRKIEAEIAGMTRDESKRRHPRQRGQKHPIAIELAWIWLRNQPDSKLSAWFRARVGDAMGRVRRIAIVALARKLVVALWQFVENGVVPEGATATV